MKRLKLLLEELSLQQLASGVADELLDTFMDDAEEGAIFRLPGEGTIRQQLKLAGASPADLSKGYQLVVVALKAAKIDGQPAIGYKA